MYGGQCLRKHVQFFLEDNSDMKRIEIEMQNECQRIVPLPAFKQKQPFWKKQNHVYGSSQTSHWNGLYMYICGRLMHWHSNRFASLISGLSWVQQCMVCVRVETRCSKRWGVHPLALLHHTPAFVGPVRKEVRQYIWGNFSISSSIFRNNSCCAEHAVHWTCVEIGAPHESECSYQSH